MVTISIKKNRKAHFNPSQSNRRIRMSSTLSTNLRKKYHFRSYPVHVNDEVMIMKGSHRGIQGKVTKVSRREYAVYVDNKRVDASNLKIIKFSMEYKRELGIERKKAAYMKKKEMVKERGN